MGHTLETRKRAYDKIVQRKRRWFEENGPCVICGSNESLELDHIDPSTKESHSIWSWSEERRNKELKKCQVLCEQCHQRKSALENTKRSLGVPNYKLRRLTDDQIQVAKEMREAGKTVREVGTFFGVPHNTIAVWTS